jgi:SAM-dependent methyltransferase
MQTWNPVMTAFGNLATRLRALPRRLFASTRDVVADPGSAYAPSNPKFWVAIARQHFETLPEATKALLEHHELTTHSHALTHFQDSLEEKAGAKLAMLASRSVSPEIIAEAIDEIVRWKTIVQCAYSHRTGTYFEDAEPFMARQWDGIIWPIIQNEDFTSVVEIACGHGRNTEFLRRHASSIELVDVNAQCVEACRQRFGSEMDGCKFGYHVTGGNGLPMIPFATTTFVYSFDSMVHFDKLVVKDYVGEVARILQPGGTAFLHHSNYGVVAPNSDWAKNHGNRSDMTADLMRQFANDAGLEMKFQRLSGRGDGWGLDDLDCLSLLRKPN